MRRGTKQLRYYTHTGHAFSDHQLMMADLPSENNRQVRHSLTCDNGTLRTILNGDIFTVSLPAEKFEYVDVNHYSSSFHQGTVSMGKLSKSKIMSKIYE